MECVGDLQESLGLDSWCEISNLVYSWFVRSVDAGGELEMSRWELDCFIVVVSEADNDWRFGLGVLLDHVAPCLCRLAECPGLSGVCWAGSVGQESCVMERSSFRLGDQEDGHVESDCG